MIEIRWHGRGGQGAFTAARLLGQAVCLDAGKYAQAFPTFGPERRGAPVLAFTRISDSKIFDRSEVESCDYVVVLDETLFGPNVIAGLKEGGMLIVNTPKDASGFAGDGYRTVTVDATALALKVIGRPITNVPMLGALAAVTGLVGIDAVNDAIDAQMAPSLRKKNKQLFLETYNAIKGGE